jgi:hypothetical protein
MDPALRPHYQGSVHRLSFVPLSPSTFPPLPLFFSLYKLPLLSYSPASFRRFGTSGSSTLMRREPGQCTHRTSTTTTTMSSKSLTGMSSGRRPTSPCLAGKVRTLPSFSTLLDPKRLTFRRNRLYRRRGRGGNKVSGPAGQELATLKYVRSEVEGMFSVVQGSLSVSRSVL